MLKGLSDLGDLFKQAQEAQSKLTKVQENLASMEVHGASGGGMIRITADATGRIKQVFFDRQLLSEETGMIEDLIAAAVNDALVKARERAQQEMAEVASGLPIPPGLINTIR